MKCSDPSTWPEPSAEHHCEEAGYGSVRVRAWAELHPKVRNHEGRGSRRPLPIVVGTLILVEVERLPRGERNWSERGNRTGVYSSSTNSSTDTPYALAIFVTVGM
jgi:hypothetical protein